MLRQKYLAVAFTAFLLLFLMACRPETTEIAVDTIVPTAILAESLTQTLEPLVTNNPPTTVPTGVPTPTLAPEFTLPIWSNQESEAMYEETAVMIAELANWAQGDPQRILDTIVGWIGSQQLVNSGLWLENSLVTSIDLDDDGTEELLVALPRLVETCANASCQTRLACGAISCLNILFFLEPTGDEYVATQFLPENSIDPWLSNPQLFAHQDLNSDGRFETILAQNWCGANTCGIDLWVGRWNGTAWEPLGSMGQSYTEITLRDRTGDGNVEIVMTGGIVGSVGAGLQRIHTLIYGWEDGRYTLQQDIPEPSRDPYFLLLDAHAALQNGELDLALQLANEARAGVTAVTPDNDLYGFFEDESNIVRIGAYAGIEAMLVHALRQEPAQMQEVLNDLEANFNQFDNPYLPAARFLWQTFQSSGDVLAACQDMQNVLLSEPDQAAILNWFGYNMEQIPPENICPLIP